MHENESASSKSASNSLHFMIFFIDSYLGLHVQNNVLVSDIWGEEKRKGGEEEKRREEKEE